ncbi:hypothetical protein GCM10023237_45720 [Streptomyces coeruleoprunus]|uniref:hypothetical protein n=1 Tax=Streptomyces coeruleoprunus TaxID=285563 RepID=UPI0031F17459
MIIGAAAVVVALAVGAYFVFGGSGNGAVAADTKGYKLTAPESVGEFKKSEGSGSSTLSDKDKKEAEALGIKNPQQLGVQYQSGDKSNPMQQKMLTLSGLWGEISDPEKALDGHFNKVQEGEDEDLSIKFIGSAEEVTPAGFEGALMKCRQAEFTFKGDTEGLTNKPVLVPVCAWADFGTMARCP